MFNGPCRNSSQGGSKQNKYHQIQLVFSCRHLANPFQSSRCGVPSSFQISDDTLPTRGDLVLCGERKNTILSPPDVFFLNSSLPGREAKQCWRQVPPSIISTSCVGSLFIVSIKILVKNIQVCDDLRPQIM